MSQFITVASTGHNLVVGDNMLTGDLSIVTANTSGAVNIATNSSRTGTTTIGDSTASGSTLNIEGDAIVSTGGTSNLMAGTLCQVGSRGTGGSSVFVEAPFVDVYAGTLVTVESGTKVDIVTPDLTCDSTGTIDLTATGVVTIEGSTTNLGSTASDTDTNVATGATTSDVTLGENITSGTITIGNTGAGSVLLKGIEMVRSSGSFSPNVGGTAGGFFTTTSRTGTYLTWGPFVSFELKIVYTSKAGATGEHRIYDMPVTAAGTVIETPIPLLLDTYTNRATLETAYAMVFKGQEQLRIAVDGVLVDVSVLASSGTIHIAGTYMYL